LKRFGKVFCLTTAVLLSLLAGCGGPSAATADTAPIYTQIASTALAMQTQTAQAVPSATITPIATNTPLVTDTPVPVTPIPLSTPKATSQASCDNMEFLGDITIPDNYVAAPGEKMDKTWRVKNLGPCTWNQDYVLVFAYGGDGTDWSNTRPVNFPILVKPGENLEITVTLKAPTTGGQYGAYFRLRNDDDQYFGQYLTILIKVQ
jgi:hypothetical protein